MKRTLNTTINRSKNEKNDEHYTQLSDIEDEVRHYRSQFAGKTVLCNCDDPRSSNFFKYFTRSFEIRLFCKIGHVHSGLRHGVAA